jgi:hypothetical protein
LDPHFSFVIIPWWLRAIDFFAFLLLFIANFDRTFETQQNHTFGINENDDTNSYSEGTATVPHHNPSIRAECLQFHKNSATPQLHNQRLMRTAEPFICAPST